MTVKDSTGISELLTPAEVKSYLRTDASDTSEDALFSSYITAARRILEHHAGRGFVSKDVTLYMDSFEDMNYLKLPAATLATITVVYLDEDGAEQSLASSYYTIINDTPPYFVLTPGQSWPETIGGIKVSYTAATDLSNQDMELVKTASLLIIGELYENRENKAVTLHHTAAINLINPLRLFIFK